MANIYKTSYRQIKIHHTIFPISKIWEGQTRTNKFFEEHYCKGPWDHSNDEKALKFVLNWQNK